MTLTVRRGEGVNCTLIFQNTGTMRLNFVVGTTARNRATGFEVHKSYKLFRKVDPGESRLFTYPWFSDTNSLTWDGQEWEWIAKVWKNFQGGIPETTFPPDWYRGGTLIGELDENVGFDRNIRII